MTPLPQGFPSAQRIENSATVRLTDSGLKFMSDNLPALVGQLGSGLLTGGVLEQGIPMTSTKLGPITANVCPQGSDPMGMPKKCLLQADIGKSKLALEAVSPHALKLSGTLETLIQYLNIDVPLVAGVSAPIQVSLGQGVNDDGSSSNYSAVPIEVDISIEADTNMAHGGRTGLSRIKIAKFDLNPSKDDLHISGKCDVPFVCGIWDAVISGVGGLVKGLLIDQLKAPLQSQIDSALCIKGNPMVSPPCPSGSHLSDMSKTDSTCVFDDNSGDCASFALGTEGTLNLGGALSSFSPTTTGGLDFLFSLGGLTPNPNNNNEPLGNLAPIANGATLSLTGGAEANPLSTCVNPAVLDRPTGIPTPDELLGNSVKNWPMDVAGPHFGLALSEDYTNYALGGIYNSGLLCLQIGTEQVAQLTTNTVGLLIASMKTLPLQKVTAPLALSLKPTQPPKVTFGDGSSADKPTMLVDLKALGIDFFVWSSDRYIRAFTITLDLQVPVNLAVSKEGLTPQITTIKVSNSVVTNSQLLKEDPKTISDGIEAVISGAVGQALGGIKPINLSSALASLGFSLNIPDSVKDQGSPGLQKLTKGSHNFLGIFAALEIAKPATPAPAPHARIHKREITPEGLRFATITKTNGPVIHLGMDQASEAGQKLEYSYQVDHGFWRPWQQGESLAVQDEVLRLQGKHTIQVKARQVGIASSESDEIASVPVTMDVDPPALQLRKHGESFSLKAVDQVALDEELSYRFAIDNRGWSAWQQYHEGVVIPVKEGSQLKVEVKDGEENVGTISQEIRGKLDTTGKAASAGCGCSVPGNTSGSLPLGGLAIAGVLAYLRAARRRRLREVVAGAAVLCVAGSWTGCSCSKDTETGETEPAGGSGGEGGMGGGGAAGSKDNPCLKNDECVTLVPGLIGSYTSAAVSSDGTVWVAGYNEADFAGEADTYGDLVVGKYDATKGEVAWDTIDGLDDKEEVDPKESNVEGWRHGKQEPGDDVGLWTSLTVGDGDKPQVSYYDVTHGALKFASFDGTKWAFHTVQQKDKSSLGRYAKMVQLNGKPVVAYLAMEPGTDGFVVSGVRVARAKVAVPAAASDWAFEDVFFKKTTPCRASFCATGTKCSATSGKCETPAKGCDKCTSDQECFNADGGPKCGAVVSSSKIEDYPNATGLYVAAAVDPTKKEIGLVFYDRIRGNLYQATKTGGAWTATIVDGQTGGETGTDTGDVGIGASLAIDASGNWHVAYVDGLGETLKYMKIAGGTTPAAPEVIDDGRAPGAMKAGADRSLVGDDSSISVVGGQITVAYQDATNGQLRVAVPPSANGVWNVKALKQDGKFGGFFSAQVVTPSSTKPQVLNFWRVGGAKVEGNVSVLSP